MTHLGPMLLVLALALVPGLAAAAEADDAEALLACGRANLPATTSVQTVEFRSYDRLGEGRRLLGRLHYEHGRDGRAQVMLRIREPQDLNGTGLLLLEKSSRADLFIYLPELRKVKRVTSQMLSGSLFGSDFTYEDFLRIQGLAEGGRHELAGEERLDGVAVRVLVHHPAPDSGSAYQRVVTYWDADTCVPVRSEMFEGGERPRKVLTVDRSAIFEQGATRLPRRLRMDDLRDQTHTELELLEIELGVEIPRRVFSTSGLERPR